MREFQHVVDPIPGQTYTLAMAHPKPFLIETSPPSTEETARLLGVSAAELRRIRKLVDAVTKTRGQRQGRGTTEPRSGSLARKRARPA